jgi:hypothetical protein
MTITPLPPAPSRTDPTTFSDRADAFVGALPAFVTEANALAVDVNNDAAAATQSATDAEQSAANAQNAAEEAQTQAFVAQAAANFRGVWLPATPYETGDTVVFQGERYVALRNNTSQTPNVATLDWFLLVAGDAEIRTPTPIEPLQEASGVLPATTLEASPYAPNHSVDARVHRLFEVFLASDTNFTSPVFSEEIDADSTTVDPQLDTNEVYVWRCRDVTEIAGETVNSDFMAVQQFTTADISVNQPTLTVEGAPNDVPETPGLTTSAFDTTPAGEDTHAATDWEVRKTTDNSLVFSSLNDTVNLLSIVIPAGNLDEDEEYLFRARHIGTTFGAGPFAEVTATTEEVFFDYSDPANIGAEVNGGFFVGIIDTQQGNIIGADDYQTGLRYALIVSPKSVGEQAAPIQWDTSNRTGQSGSFTRWNGLGSTENILAKNDSAYEAYEFIRTIRTSNPVPSDNGSDWYLPAMDELELMYRNLKPVTASNNTFSSTRAFPGTQNSGFNPSSDPTGAQYDGTNSNPSQTSLVDFQSGGAEAINLAVYWSSTDANEEGRAWVQLFTPAGVEGIQGADPKNITTLSVRAVRRVVL